MSADRRETFRLTVVIPTGIALVASGQEPPLTEQTINLSAGGMGMVTSETYDVGDLLTVALDLGEEPILRVEARVLHARPIPREPHRRFIGARFTKLTRADEDRLVRWMFRRQAERLKDHYSV